MKIKIKRIYIKRVIKFIVKIPIAIIHIIFFFGLCELILIAIDFKAPEIIEGENYCIDKDIKESANASTILIVGGSYTGLLGEHIKSNLTLLLNQSLSDNINIKFFGVAGYGGLRLRPFVINAINCVKPDVILFEMGGNEFEDQEYIDIHSGLISSRLHKINMLFHSLRTYKLYETIIYKLGISYFKHVIYSINSDIDSDEAYGIKDYFWGHLRTEQEKDAIINLFETTMKEMIITSVNNNITVILSTIPNNIMYLPAGSLNFFEGESLHQRRLPPTIDLWEGYGTDKDDLLNLLISGLEDIDNKKFEDAWKKYVFLKRKIKVMDPFLEYYLGKYYYAKGDYKAAKNHFTNANELDADPHHSYSAVNDKLKKLANTYNLTIVDFVSLLENNTFQNILGYDVFIDHVHLNSRGEQLWVDAFYPVLANALNNNI